MHLFTNRMTRSVHEILSIPGFLNHLPADIVHLPTKRKYTGLDLVSGESHGRIPRLPDNSKNFLMPFRY